MPDLAGSIQRAFERRAVLRGSPVTTCFRAVNAEGDGIEGFTLDLFADVGVLSLYRDLSEAEEEELADAIAQAVPLRSLYLKRRPKEARAAATTEKDRVAPELPLRGAPVEQLEVKENGLRFLIRPGQGLSVGLYVDMRDTRRWLRDQVAGKSVLNCFAYTCAFGVCAMAGGAAKALDIDLSRRALEWGRDNGRLNGQRRDDRDFIAGDVFEWLVRFKKRRQTFDVVILDPPSFARGKKGFFSAAARYRELVATAAPCVSERGLLLACCNLAAESWAWFEGAVQSGLRDGGRAARALDRRFASPIDFPAPPRREPPLKILAVSL